jgi:hypothetical protein
MKLMMMASIKERIYEPLTESTKDSIHYDYSSYYAYITIAFLYFFPKICLNLSMNLG